MPRRPDEGEIIEEQELRKQAHTRSTTVKEPVPEIVKLNRYSSWDKAKRVVANVLKFIALARGKTSSKKGEVTQSAKTDELHQVELVLLRQAQSESFTRELESLTDGGKSIAKNSRLIKLSPFINENDGLLSVGGRI